MTPPLKALPRSNLNSRAHRQAAAARIGRRVAVMALVAGLSTALAGCVPNPLDSLSTGSGGGQSAASSGANPDQGSAPASTFTQFNDIPIPSKADLDLDQSLVLGTEDGWIGRISLDVGYDMTEMYSFYEREMPKFGWEQLTTVRSKISTMTYRRGSRVATITLQSQLAGGTDIDFTVAPANRAVLDSNSRS